MSPGSGPITHPVGRDNTTHRYHTFSRTLLQTSQGPHLRCRETNCQVKGGRRRTFRRIPLRRPIQEQDKISSREDHTGVVDTSLVPKCTEVPEYHSTYTVHSWVVRPLSRVSSHFPSVCRFMKGSVPSGTVRSESLQVWSEHMSYESRN